MTRFKREYFVLSVSVRPSLNLHEFKSKTTPMRAVTQLVLDMILTNLHLTFLFRSIHVFKVFGLCDLTVLYCQNSDLTCSFFCF